MSASSNRGASRGSKALLLLATAGILLVLSAVLLAPIGPNHGPPDGGLAGALLTVWDARVRLLGCCSVIGLAAAVRRPLPGHGLASLAGVLTAVAWRLQV